MAHEEDYARYFACMNLFIFAMLLLVLASNLLLFFVGWEGVGLASYLLIGYYYTRPAAAQAATKAFVVNRIGDFGLLIGLLLTFYLFGTGDMAEINSRVTKEFAVGAPVIVVLSFLYFWGATGKSAQIPLYTWLPDAMEGPTPVSALIHAATMVTAGVYLVVRMHPVFLQAPWTMHLVGIIGGLTALVAALSALAQTDLKRVLAYSTVSQLGYMFLACGVGAFYAAMFHLTTHAFVKALLFLSAGNVVHEMRGTTDMGIMGGLSKIFKKTHILFLVGVLALSGIPPLAIFFSKDLILEQEEAAGYYILFTIGLITAILTAFYLTRAYCLTFMGTSRLEPKILRTIHEAPNVMVVPVTILAVLAIFGGFLGFSSSKIPFLENFLIEDDPTLVQHLIIGFEWSWVTWLSILGAATGVITAAFVYTKYKDKLGHNIAVLNRSFYLNEIYEFLFVNPLKKFAHFIGYVSEPKLIDGSVQLAVNATQETAGVLQKVQSGQIRSYISWIVIGAVLLIFYALR
jgi:NADH-quinone oxidoreductase subunit L